MAISRASISDEVYVALSHLDPRNFATRKDYVAAAVDACRDTAASTLYVKREAGKKWDNDPDAGRYPYSD
jgi:hypothetical protein